MRGKAASSTRTTRGIAPRARDRPSSDYFALFVAFSPGAIIRDGDRKRGFHASACVVPKNLFLEKIAPPFTS